VNLSGCPSLGRFVQNKKNKNKNDENKQTLKFILNCDINQTMAKKDKKSKKVEVVVVEESGAVHFFVL
jgi:hypothetical protein